jgi:hypothetical protein
MGSSLWNRHIPDDPRRSWPQNTKWPNLLEQVGPICALEIALNRSTYGLDRDVDFSKCSSQEAGRAPTSLPCRRNYGDAGGNCYI